MNEKIQKISNGIANHIEAEGLTVKETFEVIQCITNMYNEAMVRQFEQQKIYFLFEGPDS